MDIKFNMDFATKLPQNAFSNDAGLDIYMPKGGVILPGINKIDLGFGVEIPAGYAGYVYLRSSFSVQGVISLFAPIDSGYRGNIHLLCYNIGNTLSYKQDDRICQLVVNSIANVTPKLMLKERCMSNFGGTGK